MRKQFAVMVGFLTIGMTPHLLQANTASVEQRVEVAVEVLLTPAWGYDEKNNVQVVLYGNLPSSCYRLLDTILEKTNDTRFRVRQFAQRDLSGFCADEGTMPIELKRLVPFTREISIGALAAGDYTFEFNQAGTGTGERKMSVARNTAATPVPQAYAAVTTVESREVINRQDHLIVNISGWLNSSCTTLNRKLLYRREDDVWVLLPTVRVRLDVLCAQIMTPFQRRVDLGAVAPGTYLIQTRSADDQAFNIIVNVIK